MLEFLQMLAKLEKPKENLREGIIAAARTAAAERKLEVSDWEGGLRAGGALIAVQFGARREFYETMEALGNAQAEYRVIITSSNVKSMRIGEIKWILNNKYQAKDKWLIIDIERRESPKTINFMLYGGARKEEPEGAEVKEHKMAGEDGYDHYPEQREKPRKKIIYGKRGQHKEQD